MQRRLDRVLVVDIECTCWEGDPPPGEVQEIIEVGACLVDPATGAVEECGGQLVRPTRSRVGPFCTRLTTLTPEAVEGGIPFLDACHWLEQVYLSRARVWASWGDFDRRVFDGQCKAMGVRYPFSTFHLNVKTWFALAHAQPHESGMAGALETLGWPLVGTHHRGPDDAANIGRILGHLLTRGRQEPDRGGAASRSR